MSTSNTPEEKKPADAANQKPAEAANQKPSETAQNQNQPAEAADKATKTA